MAIDALDLRVAIDALDYEYNHDARTQSPSLAAARLQLTVGRRGLGPREQGDQGNQRASFLATYVIMREYTQREQHSSRAGLGCFSENKFHMKCIGTSLRGRTRV